MIKPVACEIALGESDTIIGDRLLQVKMKDLTIASIRDVLQPQKIIERYQELAPFMWAVLEKFALSPNKWCRRTSTKDSEMAPVGDDEGSDWDDDDPNVDDEETPDSRAIQWRGRCPSVMAHKGSA